MTTETKSIHEQALEFLGDEDTFYVVSDENDKIMSGINPYPLSTFIERLKTLVREDMAGDNCKILSFGENGHGTFEAVVFDDGEAQEDGLTDTYTLTGITVY